MSAARLLRLGMPAIGVALLVLNAGRVSAQTDALFTPLPQHQAVIAAQDQTGSLRQIQDRPTTASVQLVRINLNALKATMTVLDLPVVGAMRADRRKVMERSASDYTWVGDIAVTGGTAVLVVQNGDITGKIQAGRDHFFVKPLGSGIHALVKVDQRKFPPDHPHPIVMRGDKKSETSPRVSPADAKLDDPIQVDVLVAYTVASRIAYGSSMAAFAQLSVDVSNTAYTNSNANTSLRLVGSMEISYSESGRTFDTVVNDLLAGTDAQMGLVHTQRDALGADIVALLIDLPSFCGQAADIGASSETAYAAIFWSCAVDNYSFPHELGHLFGARHDPYQDPTTTPFAYGHGYTHPYNWRTIMAYPNDCDDHATGCPRLGYFSNPSILYQDAPMGTPLTHDVARVHRERVATVAAFRSPQVIPSLAISPSSDIAVYGPQGGTLSQTSFDYVLQSTGVQYEITGTPNWLTVSDPSGSVGPFPRSVTFSVNSSANLLAPGAYGPTTISFTNTTNGQGNTTRTATLTISAAGAATLQISPTTGIAPSGPQGGPFSPSAVQFQLSASAGALNYSITGLPDWLTPSAISGTLTTNPTTITLSVNANASGLAAGVYGPATITFNNITNGQGTATRTATLFVSSSSTGCIPISNVVQLQDINLNLAGHYCLTNNIDASSTASWNGGAGFVPIGDNLKAFTGILDGGGYAIDGLVMNQSLSFEPSHFIGLFAYVESSGTLRNLGLTNLILFARNPGEIVAGGLVGYNWGTIQNSYITGSIDVGGTSYPYGASAGGVVGQNRSTGTIGNTYSTAAVTNHDGHPSAGLDTGGLAGSNDGKISLSYATGAITGPSDGLWVQRTGGLVGVNTGQIQQSFAAGAVNGSYETGGLVGVNYAGGSITQSYARGPVQGQSGAAGTLNLNAAYPPYVPAVGGLIGYNLGNSSEVYSTGIVQGAPDVSAGGLIGVNSAGDLIFGYWDVQSSGQNISAGGIQKTTTQLKSALPPGFDFSVWRSDPSANDGYPYLLQDSPRLQLEATNINAVGDFGGPFAPSSFQYHLSTNAGTASYQITGVPTWLTPSSASNVVTESATTITFTVNGNAMLLAPGTYPTTITFTNTTNGFGTTTRSATLTVNVQPGAPANDNFANAFTIHLGQSKTANNTNATRQSGEPLITGNAGGKSVWWNYLAAQSGPVVVSTSGSNFDTLLGVYAGSAVNALTLIASNNDINPPSDRASIVTFNAVAGTTYHIAVDGFNSGSGAASGNISLVVADNSVAGATFIVSAVAPISRATSVGHAVTAYASIVNGSAVTATSCSLALPAGVPATFSYQTTNGSGTPTGSPNTPVNISANGTQGFYFILTPTQTMSREIAIVFKCTNTNAAPVFPGINTFSLTAGASVADMLIATATAPTFGVMDIADPSNASAFTATALNIGPNATLTFVPTDTAIGQLPSNEPLVLFICQIDPNNANCINPVTPSASTTVTLNTNQAAYFGIYAIAQGTYIPFDIPNNRIYIQAQQSGTPLAQGSVAVRMNSVGAGSNLSTAVAARR